MVAKSKFDCLKIALRKEAKLKRASVKLREAKALELLNYFPAPTFKGAVFAGVWPIGDEIDLRPLMQALYAQGERVCMPVTGPAETALKFCEWTPDSQMKPGRFGTMEPADQSSIAVPNFIFLPLLAYNLKGARLGYGGGYYDRTLVEIRRTNNIFACGVAFDTQRIPNIPMDSHDVHLGAILTPSGFKRF